MITTTVHSDKLRHLSSRARAGFTLVETMVAMTLGLLIGGAIFSALIFMGRSTMGIANYSTMNMESRLGLETFGRDIRNAKDIALGFTDESFTIVVPLPGTDPDAVEEITYTYLPNHPDRPLMRISGNDERVIMRGVEEPPEDAPLFRYYNLQGNEALYPIEVKQIQVSLKMVRYAVAIENTEQVVSARYILRNKRVSM